MGGVSYNGKGNWEAFLLKFKMVAESESWTDAAKRDQLGMCLQEEASTVYTNLRLRERNSTFDDICQKLKSRFDRPELPETAQLRFATMRQEPGEDLEAWAERLSSTAAIAFQGFGPLAAQFQETQVVHRFCVGLENKEAAQHAATSAPTSLTFMDTCACVLRTTRPLSEPINR